MQLYVIQFLAILFTIVVFKHLLFYLHTLLSLSQYEIVALVTFQANVNIHHEVLSAESIQVYTLQYCNG